MPFGDLSNPPAWFKPTCRLRRWAAAAAAAAAGALLAHKLARQFEYVYTPDRQAADLKRIPNFVPDK